MVMDMITAAFLLLPDGVKPILHSDQGWQYWRRQYRAAPMEQGIPQSTSRRIKLKLKGLPPTLHRQLALAVT